MLLAHPRVAIAIKSDNDRVKNRKYRNGKAGLPDIFGVISGGRSFFLEVKTPHGSVRPEQRDFIARALSAGALCAVVRSVEEAKKIIEAE